MSPVFPTFAFVGVGALESVQDAPVDSPHIFADPAVTPVPSVPVHILPGVGAVAIAAVKKLLGSVTAGPNIPANPAGAGDTLIPVGPTTGREEGKP